LRKCLTWLQSVHPIVEIIDLSFSDEDSTHTVPTTPPTPTVCVSAPSAAAATTIVTPQGPKIVASSAARSTATAAPPKRVGVAALLLPDTGSDMSTSSSLPVKKKQRIDEQEVTNVKVVPENHGTCKYLLKHAIF
jgi:hypothetical protein